MPNESLHVGQEVAPRPTYAPVAMALGISMIAWGLMALTLNIGALLSMAVAGVGLAAWALKTWIEEIVRQLEGRQ